MSALARSVLCCSLLLASISDVRAEGTDEQEQAARDSNANSILNFLAGTRVSGLAQVDYLRLQRSSDELGDGNGEPLNEDRFVVRRARLQVERDWQYAGLLSITELLSGTRPKQVAFDIHAKLPASNKEDPPLLQLSLWQS